MGVTRSVLIGGPAKAFYNAVTLWPQGDVSVDIVPAYSDVESAMFGKIDETEDDCVVKVAFQPMALWENLSVLFPAYYLNPSIGGRLYGNTDLPLKIFGNNADLHMITNAAMTKIPDITLGGDKPLLGPIEFTGLVGNGLDLDGANSLYTLATAGTDPAGNFSAANYKKQRYSAVWGAVAGFTAFQAYDDWTISFNPKLEPVKVQGLTVDYKMASMEIMAKCIPAGPTQANIDAALKVQGVGSPQGRRIGAASYDLTITGTGVSVVIKNAALKTAGYRFGKTALRNGELGFVTTTLFTAGVPGVLAVLS